jgi:hypothetical protein
MGNKGILKFTLEVLDTGLLFDLVMWGSDKIAGKLPTECIDAYRVVRNQRGTLLGGSHAMQQRFELFHVEITPIGKEMGITYGTFEATIAKQEIVEITGIRLTGESACVVEFTSRYIPTEMGTKTGLVDILPKGPFQQTRAFRRYDDGWRMVGPDS